MVTVAAEPARLPTRSGSAADRHFLTEGVVGATRRLVSPFGRAFAASHSPASLPPIGQTISLSPNAFGATPAVNLPPPLPTLDFIGSMRVKVLTGGADFVRPQTPHLTREAAHPWFGKVTLRQPHIDVGPFSILRIGPGGIIASWNQSMEATFEGSGDTKSPFAYETLDPAKWVAHLSLLKVPGEDDGEPICDQE
ncbi:MULTISPECIES: hypothetical protein [unclassified Streptomyces]|uniref:hypothetical protein n=1 Tax=unclassified Streptomyces TaxID=2593676 RepID=UPI002E3112C1|nr:MULTISPECIES: hypothetical protein [unclassified Streptomyces]